MAKGRVTRIRLCLLRVQAMEKREVWAGLLWVSQQKNYKTGWARWKFREIFGGWPKPQSEIAPTPPPHELVEWLGRQVRAWKARKRREERAIRDSPDQEKRSSDHASPVAGLYGSNLMAESDWDVRL